ncbi:FAD binding domain protein, partial [Vibrio parahaemolyticus EKP-028]
KNWRRLTHFISKTSKKLLVQSCRS